MHLVFSRISSRITESDENMPTGAWCWINAEYGPLRLYLHYFWVFVAAFASMALYGHLFLRLRVYSRTSSRTRSHGIISSGDPLRKKIERKAQGMLMSAIVKISNFVCMLKKPFAVQVPDWLHHHDLAPFNLPSGCSGRTRLGNHRCWRSRFDVLSEFSPVSLLATREIRSPHLFREV